MVVESEPLAVGREKGAIVNRFYFSWGELGIEDRWGIETLVQQSSSLPFVLQLLGDRLC